MDITQPPARHDGPPLPAEPHEPGPTPRRCRAEDVPCDCTAMCWRAAAKFPIEAAR